MREVGGDDIREGRGEGVEEVGGVLLYVEQVQNKKVEPEWCKFPYLTPLHHPTITPPNNTTAPHPTLMTN